MTWSETIESSGPCLTSVNESSGHGKSARPWPQTVREFEDLVDDVQHRLVQYAFWRLQSREDAEDVVQGILLQAYRDRERHKGVNGVVPFLFRMVANRCIDVLRRRKHSGVPLE